MRRNFALRMVKPWSILPREVVSLPGLIPNPPGHFSVQPAPCDPDWVKGVGLELQRRLPTSITLCSSQAVTSILAGFCHKLSVSTVLISYFFPVHSPVSLVREQTSREDQGPQGTISEVHKSKTFHYSECLWIQPLLASSLLGSSSLGRYHLMSQEARGRQPFTNYAFCISDLTGIRSSRATCVWLMGIASNYIFPARAQTHLFCQI